MRSFTLASLIIIFSVAFALPTYASGQSQSDEIGFGISPVPASDPAITANGYFIYKVQSSMTMTGSVMLKNPGSGPLTIQLAAVDAVTAQTGGSAFATSDVTPSGVATWLKFSESSVTLPAGRQKSVDFTLSVPQSARSGQYLAGISAYIPAVAPIAGADQGGTSMGASVTMQTRYVIGVQIDVAGKWMPSLKVELISLVQQPSGPFIGVQLKNDGDTFLKPSGTIVLTDSSDKRVLEQPIEMGTFIPGTGVVYPIYWSGVMAPGMYHVHVRLAYAKTQIAIYDSPLEISATSAVKVPAVATQVPGMVGSSDPIAGNPQAPVTAQMQEGSNLWPWTLVSAGILLFVIVPLLVPYLVKKQKERLQSEVF